MKTLPTPSNKKRSLSQERSVAKIVGGKLVPGSGCSRRAAKKGDVTTHNFLIECKTTVGKTLRVEAKWLAKIVAEASMQRKIPVLAFSFGDGEQWFAMKSSDLAGIIDI